MATTRELYKRTQRLARLAAADVALYHELKYKHSYMLIGGRLNFMLVLNGCFKPCLYVNNYKTRLDLVRAGLRPSKEDLLLGRKLPRFNNCYTIT